MSDKMRVTAGSAPKPLNSTRPTVNRDLLSDEQLGRRINENLDAARNAAAVGLAVGGPVKAVIAAGATFIGRELSDHMDTRKGDNSGNSGSYAPDIKDYNVNSEVHRIAKAERDQRTPVGNGEFTTPTLRDIGVSLPAGYFSVREED